MLDSLPTELIEHVVRLTVSSSFLPQLYYDRLVVLTSLSLTSSKLRSVVQLILFEVVQFKSHKAVESFLEVVEADKALGERAKSMRVEGQEESPAEDEFELGKATFARLAATCPRVEDLRIFWQRVELGWLECFTNLRCLVHTNGRQRDFRHVSFPHLEELSGSENDFGKLMELIDMPSLRALHLQRCHPPAWTALLPRLPHLEQISCDFNTLGSLDMSIWSSRTLVVAGDIYQDWWAGWNSKDLTSVKHLRLDRLYYYQGPIIRAKEFPHLIQTLRKLIKRLRKLSVVANLSSLYLPPEINPDFAHHELEPAQMSTMRDALSAFSSLNVEVVFEHTPHLLRESLVSPEFWRRSKARKEKGQEQVDHQ